MTPTLAVQSAVAAVASRTCVCGKRKSLLSGFCSVCWRALPVTLQRRMHPVTGGLDALAYAEGCRVIEFRAKKRAAWKAAAGKEGDGSEGKTKDEGCVCVG